MPVIRDIVQHLRNSSANPDNDVVWGLDEAADEIERLRTAFAHYFQPSPSNRDMCARCSLDLRDEVHRDTYLELRRRRCNRLEISCRE